MISKESVNPEGLKGRVKMLDQHRTIKLLGLFFVLFAFAAMACSAETVTETVTVEVPGETIVVEKEVVKTVEVEVVVEKEVVKTVEVPG
jgi:hypothetical protein